MGEKTIVDGKGQSRRWAAELAAELLSRQAADGSWSNPVDRWWEGDPSLVTAYAVQALTICTRNLKE
jgi:squalene-hopene/tetraprenyl-beta-curcumene cyclase